MLIANIARFVFLLFSGTIGGIMIGYLASRPARTALDPVSFIRYQQIVHVQYQPMMQVLVLGSALAGLVWLITLRDQLRSKRFLYAGLAVGFALAVLAITLTVNMPINEQLMAWNAADPPDGWAIARSRWESAHLVRTIVSVAGFAAGLIALSRRTDA